MEGIAEKGIADKEKIGKEKAVKEKELTGRNGKKGITGSTLKLIAIIAMFIDHVGAIVLARMLMIGPGGQMGVMQANMKLLYLYLALRFIGRLGFPIFCYLLIEGFRYTRNVKKYAGRLFLFALISELPFDLGFTGSVFYMDYQNVFFTLFIGLLVIAGLRFAEGKAEWNKGLRAVLVVCMLVAGAGAAELLRTDYGAMGVLTIVIMYLFRKNRVLEAGAGCVMLTAMQLMEISSFFVLIPIRMYNGRRGWNIKWFFYAFYPLHILLLYLIACAMGLGGIRLMM